MLPIGLGGVVAGWLGAATADRLNIQFDKKRGRVILPRYPFPARKTRVLERSDIVEIIDWFPPAIQTTDGEFLFVSRMHFDDLKTFAGEEGIPLTKRYDVWGDLLDPFLDTEHSPEWLTLTARRMGEAGLSVAEIEAIRARVSERMLWLTSITWEWAHYGLYDALSAMKHPLPFMRGTWRSFYPDAMEIARRGLAVKWPPETSTD